MWSSQRFVRRTTVDMVSVPAVHRRAAKHERFHTALTYDIHTSAIHQAPRANPFSEVTFCRLLLPTFFYRPEAARLGDLMLFMVALCVGITPFLPLFSEGKSIDPRKISWPTLPA